MHDLVPTARRGSTRPAHTAEPRLSGIATAGSRVRLRRHDRTTDGFGPRPRRVSCSGRRPTTTAWQREPRGQHRSDVYVAPFTFTGFQSPVDNAPTLNKGHAGRTYPIKFKLTGIDGLPITVLPAVLSTTYSTGATCTGLGDALETTSSGNSQLTFDAATNTFQYNWKTPNQKGCYVFRLKLADGSTKTAMFSLK